jgi:hypothetical protein
MIGFFDTAHIHSSNVDVHTEAIIIIIIIIIIRRGSEQNMQIEKKR